MSRFSLSDFSGICANFYAVHSEHFKPGQIELVFGVRVITENSYFLLEWRSRSFHDEGDIPWG